MICSNQEINNINIVEIFVFQIFYIDFLCCPNVRIIMAACVVSDGSPYILSATAVLKGYEIHIVYKLLVFDMTQCACSFSLILQPFLKCYMNKRNNFNTFEPGQGKMCVMHMRTTKAQISLRIRAV